MQRLVAHAATNGHEWVSAPETAKGHVDVHTHVTSQAHMIPCGLGYHLKSPEVL